MGICRICQKEMSDLSVATCEGKVSIKYPDGQVLAPIRYDPPKLHLPRWFRCPDCNVAPGGIHHQNCDQEHCPKCGGQLIGCDCFSAEGEEQA
jgi:hypothetical protein